MRRIVKSDGAGVNWPVIVDIARGCSRNCDLFPRLHTVYGFGRVGGQCQPKLTLWGGASTGTRRINKQYEDSLTAQDKARLANKQTFDYNR
jgi:hypothetical protein